MQDPITATNYYDLHVIFCISSFTFYMSHFYVPFTMSNLSNPKLHVTCHNSHVTFHMSNVIYHISDVTCNISHVSFHMFQYKIVLMGVILLLCPSVFQEGLFQGS